MSAFCQHVETTAPDDHGFVICVKCLAPVRRPESTEEMLKRIRKK